MTDPKFRHVCFTLNNWTQEEYDRIASLECRYLVIGKEVGEQGTPHLQGYIEFNGQKTLRTLKKMLPRCHIESRKGTPKQAANYCKEDGDYIEKGEISKQGERTDLTELQTAINERTQTVQQIRQNNPMIYHQYGRTLNTLEDDLMEQTYRTQKTHGTWLWGGTGAGKSHLAFKNFTTNTHYVWKLNDNGWQDGYKQQPTVIIDDFRGTIAYDEMLRMIDSHPNYTVPRRGRAPIPFTSTHVIITSSLPPTEVYHRRHEKDSIEQLTRRIQIYELPSQFKNASEVLGVILNPSTLTSES
uniref:Replication-associated protein n=2 Tax=Cressdnaviricota TaxID=2732416 RepID=A0A890ULG3_9VIRU|nr:MAG: replication-associated protein [Cressdnaviricota sp.]